LTELNSLGVRKKIQFARIKLYLCEVSVFPITILKYAEESTTSLRELNRDWNSFALFFCNYRRADTHTHIHIRPLARTKGLLNFSGFDLIHQKHGQKFDNNYMTTVAIIQIGTFVFFLTIYYL
jgi:hypothetical protein